MSRVAKVAFVNYEDSIGRALDLIEAPAHLPRKGLIIIKPNLTNSSPPPVTTGVGAAEAVWRYCRAHTGAEVIIGEGCGSGKTPDVFDSLGYTDLAGKYGLELVDFNKAECVTLENEDAMSLKQFHIPAVVPDAFVISLPVLKDHSFTQTTVSMKNMFGIAPGRFYCGSWNKSRLHSPSAHKNVVDVCLYKKPDLSVVDASVALAGMHLAGRHRHIGLILAGLDPVAVDAVASGLLGHNPRSIEYLRLANGLLGSMDDIETVDG